MVICGVVPRNSLPDDIFGNRCNLKNKGQKILTYYESPIHHYLKIGLVYSHTDGQNISEKSLSCLHASIQPCQVQKQVWSWQYIASPFQTSLIIERRDYHPFL